MEMLIQLVENLKKENIVNIRIFKDSILVSRGTDGTIIDHVYRLELNKKEDNKQIKFPFIKNKN